QGALERKRGLSSGHHALCQVGKKWLLDPLVGVVQLTPSFLVLHPLTDEALIQLSSIPRKGLLRGASQRPRDGQKHEGVAGELSELSWHSLVEGAEAEFLQKAPDLVGRKAKDLERPEWRRRTG